MTYSRANPSPRYQELTREYRQLHVEGERLIGLRPENTFPGLSLPKQAGRIKRLIEITAAQNVLDYGSGKGRQYDLRKLRGLDDRGEVHESIQDYWGVDFVQCYDPCYEAFAKLPAGRFHGVICTDVLEHCPEEDIDWIIDELFGYAERFVFANVACYPAKKHLPSGENAHCTIKPPGWWREHLERAAAKRPGVAWEVWVQWREDTADGPRFVEERLGSAPAR